MRAMAPSTIVRFVTAEGSRKGMWEGYDATLGPNGQHTQDFKGQPKATGKVSLHAATSANPGVSVKSTITVFVNGQGSNILGQPRLSKLTGRTR